MITKYINLLVQALLQLHPYHIDTLLQLSEVCKMSEDRQMAAELVGKLQRRIQWPVCNSNNLF